MTTADFAHFSARLVELGELFDAKLSESKQLLYFQALSDLPLELVTDAVIQAARACKFFPKPVELRALVLGDDEDRAELAWLEYKRLARSCGGYGSPTFTDPALADALVAVFGSWEGACWSDFSPEMWSSKRKEFGRVYRAMRSRNETVPKQLPGFFERENGLRGYAPTNGHALTEGDHANVATGNGDAAVRAL